MSFKTLCAWRNPVAYLSLSLQELRLRFHQIPVLQRRADHRVPAMQEGAASQGVLGGSHRIQRAWLLSHGRGEKRIQIAQRLCDPFGLVHCATLDGDAQEVFRPHHRCRIAARFRQGHHGIMTTFFHMLFAFIRRIPATRPHAYRHGRYAQTRERKRTRADARVRTASGTRTNRAYPRKMPVGPPLRRPGSPEGPRHPMSRTVRARPSTLSSRRRASTVRRVLCACLAGLAVFTALDAAIPHSRSRQIVLARHRIARGQIIRARDLEVRTLAGDPALTCALSSETQAAGLIAQITITKGDIVTATVAGRAPVPERGSTVLEVRLAGPDHGIVAGDKVDLVSTTGCGESHTTCTLARDALAMGRSSGGDGESRFLTRFAMSAQSAAAILDAQRTAPIMAVSRVR